MAFLLAEAACFAQIYETPALLPVVFLGFAAARTLGGCKIVLSPCAKDTGLAHIFAENSDKKAVAVTLAIECVLFVTAAGLLVYTAPYGSVRRRFGRPCCCCGMGCMKRSAAAFSAASRATLRASASRLPSCSRSRAPRLEG